MGAMEWKAGYDAGTEPYETPDLVKAYYKQNGRYPAFWSNPVVKDWIPGTGTIGGFLASVTVASSLFWH